MSSGVPTHIRYLGFPVGNFGQVNSTISRINSFDSPTLTHQTAIQSRAYCDKKTIEKQMQMTHRWAKRAFDHLEKKYDKVR